MQRADNFIGRVANLEVGEAQLDAARFQMGLIAPAIFELLHRRAVVGEAIGFQRSTNVNSAGG